MNSTMKEFADILYRSLKEICDWIKEFGMDDPFLFTVHRAGMLVVRWIEKNVE